MCHSDPTYGHLINRMWFCVVCTLIDNDIRHHSGQMLWTHKAQRNSERDPDRDTKKEQALSITFSQCDWFIPK